MMENLNSNIWIVNQKQKYHGLEVGARMSIIRLSNRRLLLISPVTITDDIANELSELGCVEYIIAPNLYHHLYLRDCRERYSNASVYVAPGLDDKYSDLNCISLTSTAPAGWSEYLDQTLFEGYAALKLSGSVVLNEVVFFHKESKTLILTDVAFHFGSSSSFITKLIARVSGVYNVLGPTALEKYATKQRQKARAALLRVMSWPFEAVIMAHGEVIKTNGKSKLEIGYQWLLRESPFNKIG